MSEKINIRLYPDEVSYLGLKPNRSGQHRITREQITDIKKRRLEPDSKFEEHCQAQGIDPTTVSAYWNKTDSYSVLVRPDYSGEEGVSLIEKVENLIKEHRPDYSFIKQLPDDSKNLLVLDIADLHIGKLSRDYETNDEYNIDIAKKRAVEGISGILSKASNFGIDRVMFVIGNDIMHTDNARRTTTSGTPQDTIGMFYDMFNESLDTYVKIIESLITKYKVDIVFNPSNHDYTSGWMLARTVSTWFRNTPNVTIDDTINHRKYYQYGKNMIATNHGDGAKISDLPLLMANESPKMWADTTYRYCYVHHLHHKRVTKFLSGVDFVGVTIEHLRSPSSSDSWHHRNGYVGAKKAIEGFIHNYNDGQIARITHYFK